jgi:hypothetical protein
MTHEEEHVLNIFIKMVAEFNDAQVMLDLVMEHGDQASSAIASKLSVWTQSLRAGETQEDLNNLVLKLVEQQEV